MAIVIPYKEIEEKVKECGSISAAAKELTRKLGYPVHKGSLARSYKLKRDLKIRPKRRKDSPIFKKLSPEKVARLFYLATKWGIEKVGDAYSMEAWEIVDRAKDLLLRLDPPSSIKSEDEIFAWVLVALKRYIFLRNCDLRRRAKETSESDLEIKNSF